MPDPYATVAENYDIMIDWPVRLARERPFFAELLARAPGRRVLDIGCGTGHHSRLFAEMDARVVGLDPSLPMLARARMLFPGDNPRFQEGGFDVLPVLDGPFDLVVVLGNTLAYVRDQADLRRTLAAIRGLLAPGGLFCVQVVNYDSLRVERDRWLPVIHRRVDEREYLFLREYRRQGRHVEFSLITLIREHAWVQAVERSRHYPITRTVLTRTLAAAGFSAQALYGDFAQAPYDPMTSPGLIVTAANCLEAHNEP